MASWVFVCKNCSSAFTHSEVGETLSDYFLPVRPEVPPEGVERQCPSCKFKSTYTRADLRYQSESKGRAHCA